MKKDNKIFSDFAKLTGSVLNTAINAKREIGQIISEQVSKILKNHDFVSREEFEVLKKIALKTKTDFESFSQGSTEKPISTSNDDKSKSLKTNKKTTSTKT